MSERIRPFETGDKERVCDFLAGINREEAVTPNYLWGRWAWQFGPYCSEEHLGCMGVAEEQGKIVGLAAYESDLGEARFCVAKGREGLKERLLEYAMTHLSQEGKLRVLLPDEDRAFQRIARRRGFTATQEGEAVAQIDLEPLRYELPEGFRVMDFASPEFDPDRYYNAIWRGFNNQRPRNRREIASAQEREEFSALHYDRLLRVLVVAPNGDYASHCGMWHLPGERFAYVEPVFTLPEYRGIGLPCMRGWNAAGSGAPRPLLWGLPSSFTTGWGLPPSGGRPGGNGIKHLFEKFGKIHCFSPGILL